MAEMPALPDGMFFARPRKYARGQKPRTHIARRRKLWPDQQRSPEVDETLCGARPSSGLWPITESAWYHPDDLCARCESKLRHADREATDG